MKIIIGNRAYSSWSLRGWLAARQSALPFETLVVPLYDADWPRRKQEADITAGSGKMPILWDGDLPVWDSLAIIEWLAERVGRDRFWPSDDAARAFARSISAEMHSGFMALRQACPMNVRRRLPTPELTAALTADIERITLIWTTARQRHGAGGDFLFGAFSAADIMFAPVVTRFMTYGLPLGGVAADYAAAVMAHPWMREWIADAEAEPWVLSQYEG